MKSLVVSLLAIAWCVTAFAAEPANGFKLAGLNIGYLRSEEFGSRVAVPELAGYVKKLQADCEDFFAGTTTPENLDIVVAVKPGKVSRVWFVSSRSPAAGEKRDALRAKLEAVAAPDVSGGPIAFAMVGKIAGGDPALPPENAGAPPVPAEWKDAPAKQDHAVQFDEVLASVWPGGPVPAAVSASAKPAENSKDEFVTQPLEPTGGKIQRPKTWFYSDHHHDSVFEWVVSKEDASGSQPYETGVRIQAYAGVKEHTGKTARQFILDFVAEKRKEAAKLEETCKAEDQGMFTRMCIETDEGPRHVRYSLFWGKEGIDIAVISEAATTQGLWGSYAATFDRMSAFELIDMKHIEEKPRSRCLRESATRKQPPR